MSSLLHSPSVSSLPPCLFSCRIVKIDFYLTAPIKNLDICFSQFRSCAIEKVPVVRIFGAAPSGQKACLHIHGAFPYLYIPCATADPNESYLRQLCTSIDHALQVSLGAGSRPVQHVFKALVVKGIPFYGYHKTEELFIKIYLYNPMIVKRLSELLLAGAVMNTSLQPHEAHIPFPLQFMIDYNLYGMNYVHLAAVKFRVVGEDSPACTTPPPSHRQASPLSPQSSSSYHSLLYNPSQTYWDMDNLTSDMKVSTPRQSMCELEVDALAADILNRHELSLVSGGYPGLKAIWEEERQRRVALGIDTPLSPPLSPERKTQTIYQAEAKLRLQFKQVLCERFGESDSPGVENNLSSTETSPFSCTQSCDLDLHLPDQSCDLDLYLPDQSNGSGANKAAAIQDVDAIVDTTAIEQSMELTQKLSANSICKSTDVELLNLMLELCETPIHHTQTPEPNLLSKQIRFSQSISQALVRKRERAQSVASQRSLFSSSSSHHSDSQPTAVVEEEKNLKDELSIETNPSMHTLHNNVRGSLSQSAIAPVQNTTISGIKLTLDSSSDTLVEEMATIPSDAMASSMESSETAMDTLAPPKPNIVLGQLTSARDLTTLPTPELNATLKSEQQTGSKVRPDTISELDTVISPACLSGPLPILPVAQEVQNLHFLDETNLERKPVFDFECDDDIPCAQVISAQNLTISSQDEVGLFNIDPNWNAAEIVSPKTQSPCQSRSDSQSSNKLMEVLLEYDIPEIGLIHSTNTEDSTLYDIDVDSQEPDSLSQASKQLSTSALRKQLLKLCSQGDGSPFDCESGDEAGFERESEEEEIFLMSQKVWDSIEEHLSSSSTLEQADNSANELHSDSVSPASKNAIDLQLSVPDSQCNRDSPVSDEYHIPQLDGSDKSPKPNKKTTKHRKTLGLRRRKRLIVEKPKVNDSSALIKSPGTLQIVEGTTATVGGHNTRKLRSSRPCLSLRKPHKPPVEIRLNTDIPSSKSHSLVEMAKANCFSLKLTKVKIPFTSQSQISDSCKATRKRSKSGDRVIKEIFSKEKCARLAEERDKRYETRCSKWGIINYSGKLLTFDEQLQMAMKVSLQAIETNQLIGNNPKQDTKTHPDSECSSVDLNRTIVEESPVSDLGKNNLDPNGDDAKRMLTEDHETLSNQDSEDAELDASFCSIPESPPFTSSPVHKLGLQTDSSFHSSPGGSLIHHGTKYQSNKSLLQQLDSDPIMEKWPEMHSPEDLSRDYASFIEQSTSPIKDSDSPVPSQSSEDTQTHSFDDFHLAVTSESDEDLYRPVQEKNRSDISIRQQDHINSCVTLKRDKVLSSQGSRDFVTNQLIRSPLNTVMRSPQIDCVSLNIEPWKAKTYEITILTPALTPPTTDHLIASLSKYNLPSGKYLQPFYENPEDVQAPKEIGGRVLKVLSKMVYDLKEFQPHYTSDYTPQLSFSGLQTLRAILMVPSYSHPEATHLPPPNRGSNKSSLYSIEDHRQDVLMRSSKLPHKRVVITPAKPPPLAAKIISAFKNCTSNENEYDNIRLMDYDKSGTKLNDTCPAESSLSFKSESLVSTPAAYESSVAVGSGSIAPKFVRSSTPMITEGDEAVVKVEPQQNTAGTPSRKSHTVDTRKMIQPLPFTPIVLSGKRETSQLEGPTPQNTYGFKVSQSALPSRNQTHQHLTCMSLEVHVSTRGSLRPDPDVDPILALFYFIHNDWPSQNCNVLQGETNTRLGVIAIDINDHAFEQPSPRKQNAANLGAVCDSVRYLDGCGVSPELDLCYVSSEVDLLDKLVALVRETDPDIIMGYEMTMLSWGYCIDRAAHLNINLSGKLSRVSDSELSRKQRSGQMENPWLGNGTGVQLSGRISLNVWRLMRHEVALNVYSFENVVYHVLHQRLPLFSFKTLTSWYGHPTRLYRHRVVEYYVKRCQGNYQLLDSFNLIGRTSEFARLYGIEFENVLDRGSQYRVESMMLRLAKPANFIAVSPNVQQRARMAAPECLPLILEPESKFYTDPVLVLDFQSLYPSMVIAYNYCFSTCLGQVQNIAKFGDFTFGATSLNVPNSVLKKLKDSVHISPNGVVFVKSHVCQGILPRMLKEILGTRVMVKNSMKQHKGNKALNRMLDARQLGLKLIANVTYGYTAANFSGRMPCVEIADSIVRKGRETLERAIQLVNSTPEWGGKVVYGDTDSLFVLLKGASKEEAFRIGKEITNRVTADNPPPVKLKFEKVYLPCILQTKKRYVGYMYESLDQSEPVFDAKGIETVRRDGCPAVAKVLEKSLHILFTTRNLSLLKSYVQRQCGKLLNGQGNLQEYIFAKEYRGREYYRPGACVPALELARKGLQVDKRSEPRPAERVPYVIVYGTPGQPLIQLVRRPEDLLTNPALRLNGIYYITKQILPALDRAFSLLGVNVRQWYDEMPRVIRAPAPKNGSKKRGKGTLGQYFATIHCPVCHQLTIEGVCSQCKTDPQKVAIVFGGGVHGVESTHSNLSGGQCIESAQADITYTGHGTPWLCKSCVGSPDSDYYMKCVSFDCPVLYRRSKAEDELGSTVASYLSLHHELSYHPYS